MSKESDIKKLCESILDVCLCVWDNPSGGYQYSCPICQNLIEIKGKDIIPTMHTFKHDENCGFLVAKRIKGD
jgi:hypothetical protein